VNDAPLLPHIYFDRLTGKTMAEPFYLPLEKLRYSHFPEGNSLKATANPYNVSDKEKSWPGLRILNPRLPPA